MAVKGESQGNFQHLVRLGEKEDLANQATKSLSQSATQSRLAVQKVRRKATNENAVILAHQAEQVGMRGGEPRRDQPASLRTFQVDQSRPPALTDVDEIGLGYLGLRLLSGGHQHALEQRLLLRLLRVAHCSSVCAPARCQSATGTT